MGIGLKVAVSGTITTIVELSVQEPFLFSLSEKYCKECNRQQEKLENFISKV